MKGVTEKARLNIHYIINMNGRFPGTYDAYQRSRCVRHSVLSRYRQMFIEQTKSILAGGKGGVI